MSGNTYNVNVGIHSSPAAAGAREFKRSALDVKNSAKGMSNELATTDKKMKALQGSANLLKRALIGFAAGFSLARAIRDITQFSTSLSGLQAVTGASIGQMAELTKVAREMGAATIYSASEAAEGMKMLGMAGFNTNAIIKTIPATLNLAVAGMLDIASAAEITANIMAGFSVETDKAMSISDALARAASSANTDVQSLGVAMSYVAPIAGALGISMQDTTAAIATLSNAGIKSTKAGTSLRRILSSLTTDGSGPATDALSKLGLTMDQLNPQTHSLIDIVDTLAKAGLGAGEAMEIFGDQGGPAILALTSQRETLKQLTESINDSAGAAEEMAKIMGNNLRGDALEMESALEELAHQIGDAGLTKSLRQGLQSFTAFARTLGGAQIDLDGASSSVVTFAEAGTSVREAFKSANPIVEAFKDNMDGVITGLGLAIKLGAGIYAGTKAYALAVGTATIAASFYSGALARINVQLALAGRNASLSSKAMAVFTTSLNGAALYTGRMTLLAKSMLLLRTSVMGMASAWVGFEIGSWAYKEFGAVRVAAAGALNEILNAMEHLKFGWLVTWETMKASVPNMLNGVRDMLASFYDSVSGMYDFVGLDGMAASAKRTADALRGSKTATGDLAGEYERLAATRDKNIEKNDLILKQTIDHEVALYRDKQETQALASASDDLADSLGDVIDPLEETGDGANNASEALKDLLDRLDPVTALVNTYVTEQKMLNDMIAQGGPEVDRYKELLHRLGVEFKANVADLDTVGKAYKSLREELFPLERIQNKFEEDLKTLNEKFPEGTRNAEEYRVALKALRAEFQESKADAMGLSDQSEVFETTWKRAIERVDDTFVSMWDSILSKSNNFMDALKTNFKKMLAEMAHAALTRPIVVAISGAGGFGATGAASAASGGIAGVSGAVSSGTGLSSLIGMAAGGFGTAGAYASAVTSSMMTQGLAAGFQGGLSLAGSSLMSGQIAAAIGAALPPLLLVAGVATAVNKLTGGGLFGTDYKTTSQNLNLSVAGDEVFGSTVTNQSKKRSLFRGTKRRTLTENFDASSLSDVLSGLVGTVATIADRMGVGTEAFSSFRASTSINIEGKSSEEVEGLVNDWMMTVTRDALIHFLDNTENIPKYFSNTAKMFKESTEEFLGAFELLAGIEYGIKNSPLQVATSLVAENNKTLTERYNDQVNVLKEAINMYDQSLPALKELSAAYEGQRQMAIELARSLMEVKTSVSAMFADTATSIRESLMSDDELYAFRRSRVEGLVDQLGASTDPGVILSLSNQINDLVGQVFNSLEDTQKFDMADGFLQFLTNVEALVDRQVGVGLNNVGDTSQMMSDAAVRQLEVAEVMRESATEFADSVDRFSDAVENMNSLVYGGASANEVG